MGYRSEFVKKFGALFAADDVREFYAGHHYPERVVKELIWKKSIARFAT